MLTPRPVYPGRILLARRGMGQITLPSRATPSAMAGGGFTRRGLWGLGQTDSSGLPPEYSGATDGTFPSYGASTDQTSQSVSFPQGFPTGAQSSGGTTPPFTPATGSGVPTWLQNLFTGAAKTASTIAVQQTNPFAPGNLPKGFYYQSGPGGTVMSTAGVPVGGSALTATTLNNMLPIILIGGALVLFMSMAKK